MKTWIRLLAGLLLVVLIGQPAPSSARATDAPNRDATVILVQNRGDQTFVTPYVRALQAVGLRLQVRTVTETTDWSRVKLAIVPGPVASALEAGLRETLVGEVSRGLNLITDGPSTLAQRLGVKTTSALMAVQDVVDHKHSATPVHWHAELNMPVYSLEAGKTFVTEKQSGSSVMSGGTLDNGKFIYMGVPLDAPGSWGIDRFPYFHEALFDFFGMQSDVRVDNLSAYVDWGYYYDQDPTELAARFKGMGIRKVFLSNWYDFNNVADFYTKFIQAAHVNGLLVYSWYEFPMVSKPFWDAHPQWRQKTAAGEDAHIDWRYLMALEIPECMEAVKAAISDDMKRLDWDGVNLSELYFESPNTYFTQNDLITPMSDYFRSTFKAQYGTDPKELFAALGPNHYKNNTSLFQAYLRERIKLITGMHNELLAHVAGLGLNRPLDLIITTVDTTIEKDVGDEIGVDMGKLLKLRDTYPVEVIVEDPFTLWSHGPDRYKEMAEIHTRAVGSNTLALDINIVDRQNPGQRATARQTGLEFVMLLAEGAKQFKQVAVYEPKVTEPDNYKYAPYALGAAVSITPMPTGEYQAHAPTPFAYRTADGASYEATVSGEPWPFRRSGEILLPAGDYTFQLLPSADDQRLWIADFNGSIVSGTRTEQGVSLTYANKHRVAVTLNKPAGRVLVNGEPANPTAYYRDGQFVYELPAGTNRVDFVREAASGVHVAVNGKLVSFTAPAVVQNGTALYPLSDVLQTLGAQFTWNSEHKSVAASLNGYHIWAQIGNATARANGADVPLEVAPQLINGRTMAPIRFLAEGLNQTVGWDAATRTITIQSK